MKLLEIDPDRMNVNGGAVAMGHPIGYIYFFLCYLKIIIYIYLKRMSGGRLVMSIVSVL
jgi:hypothetical protein